MASGIGARLVGPGFSPLAEALGLGASGYSPWIVEGAVRLGTAGPFGAAAALLRHFTGVSMSQATVRRLTIAAGATMRQLELAFSDAARADPAAVADPAGAPDVPVQVSVDGSLVALAGEGWREVKLVAIGERGEGGAPGAAPGAAPGSLTAISYAATLGTAEAFGDEALGEVVWRGLPWATDVVTVNDGAAWIQGFVDLHCPHAGRVLDFAHAVGYLASAAAEAFGDGTTAATGWFTAHRHTLRSGDPDAVLSALRALPDGERRDQAWHYLATRRAQIAYRDFVARGWPIGSGCVESAHKGVIQDRLKRRGMRWSRPVAEGLIALRVVAANDRWDVTWARVGAHQRADRRDRAAARRAARRRPPPRPKLVHNGRPTADHPWRTFHLRRSPHPSPTM